ncbi:Sec-independent protein translocase TatA [Sporosarcina sp. P37]|uniref:twin-arginine translocase TatA/TatE family subunit n=1 Tax=unclassified Sporosarcina TaxID=2647733 RepID=UPI0009BD2C99|nr:MULTISPECIES: twin-arginine translocase TatA/TatE family subunit [unclassified Sporosarcina]ARD48617.1 preprotein translocase subunit TatA [Sporosarcina sp. P33]ARK25121.1 Sec-independent protein translocase TatA [Sporosarcina sp. P37]PID17889.1 twin-arginine translocase TatA/TatE family subunit [Sporosarcina sp. P35]
MNLAAIGVPGLIIILVIILILFGPRKLPEVGSAVGKTLAEFKKSAKDIMDDEDEKDKTTVTSAKTNELERKDTK